MDSYLLVLNAGSSSLKFCVFRGEQAGWHPAVRGQIDGLGTAPRFSARDSAGVRVVDDPMDAGLDGRGAIDALAAWLRSRFGGAAVVAIGHRVVHGGPRHAGPAIVTAEVLDDLRTLIPLAPLHQPYNLAAIDAAGARLPGVPQ